MVAVATTSLNDFIATLLSQNRMACRLMLRKVEGGWKLQAMMAESQTVAAPLFSYDYGHTAFVSGAVKTSRIASWLRRNKGSLRGFRFKVPELETQVHSQRYPSHVQRNIWLSVPHPFSIHTIHIKGRDNQQSDYSLLVRQGMPTFRNTIAAGSELIYGSGPNANQREPEEITFRIVHDEAVIDKVRINPSYVDIAVTGRNVAGVRLELRMEPGSYYEKRVRKAGQKRFPLKTGVPERLWAVLSRRDRWLDYRDLDLRGDRPRSDDDMVIEPTDIAAQIQGLIFRGESETIEFKREVSNEKTTTFLRTVAAFANATGGVILLGVVNQTGEVVGIRGDVLREKDRISHMIHDVLVPQPKFRFENCKLQGKDVIALFVERGDSPPYGVNPRNPRFCVRRGATTQPATQAEVRLLAQRDNYSATTILDYM